MTIFFATTECNKKLKIDSTDSVEEFITGCKWFCSGFDNQDNFITNWFVIDKM